MVRGGGRQEEELIGSRGVISTPIPHYPAYGFDRASLAPCHSGGAGEIAANAAAALYRAVPIGHAYPQGT